MVGGSLLRLFGNGLMFLHLSLDRWYLEDLLLSVFFSFFLIDTLTCFGFRCM